MMPLISHLSPRSREMLRRKRIQLGALFAKLGRSYHRRRVMGRDAILDRSVQVIGWKSIKVGDFSIISEDSWINVNLPSEDGTPRLVIGNYSFIGRRNILSSGLFLSLGDYTLTGPDCHFLGSDHVFDSPFLPYSTTGNTGTGSIKVGTNCWFGSFVKVIGSIDIGHGSIIGAGSLVRHDVPPFSIVAGSPARILKRYDMINKRWIKSDQFTDEMNRLIPSEADYNLQIKATVPHARLPLLARGRRAGDML